VSEVVHKAKTTEWLLKNIKAALWSVLTITKYYLCQLNKIKHHRKISRGGAKSLFAKILFKTAIPTNAGFYHLPILPSIHAMPCASAEATAARDQHRQNSKNGYYRHLIPSGLLSYQ